MKTLFGTEDYARYVAAHTPSGLLFDQPWLLPVLGGKSQERTNPSSIQLTRPDAGSGICRADPGRPFVPALLTLPEARFWFDRLVDIVGPGGLAEGLSVGFSMPPLAYYPDPNEGLAVRELLLVKGAHEVSRDICQHLDLTGVTGWEAWAEGLPTDQRRHVRFWADRAAFIEDDPDWTGAYRLIVANRQARGWGVSLSLDALRGLTVAFPGRYRLLTLRSKTHEQVHTSLGALLACVVLVYVSDRIAYTLYTGFEDEFRAHSPLIPLLAFTIGYVAQQGITLLDLGTSSVAGAFNEGVYAFKKALGGVDSLKSRWVVD